MNEPVYGPCLAVIAVHRYPGLSGNRYRAKIVDDVRQVNRCNRDEVTQAGLEEVTDLISRVCKLAFANRIWT